MNKESLKDKIYNSKLFCKLKSIKHLDIVIVVVFVSVLLLIYFSDFPLKTSTETIDENSYTFTSYISYTNDLETRLTNVLSAMKGVGKVSVMITLNSSPELVIAYNTEEKTTNSGLNTKDTVTIIKEPIIITKNGTSYPLVLTEVLPTIKGVIIVAQGADNVSVKLDILNATMKLLNISAKSIEIFAGE